MLRDEGGPGRFLDFSNKTNLILYVVSFLCAGLAVGLDPQGYGNPDFCWLSVHDTLIWSFTGPIFVVVLVCT